MPAKFALLVVLTQALFSAAQLNVGAFFYACYPSNPSADTAPTTCPALPVTIADAFFMQKCLCTDITDSTGAASVYCTSPVKPTADPATFNDLCGQSRLAASNTCPDIQAINNITQNVCNHVEDQTVVLKALCIAGQPDPKVQAFLNKYPMGQIVLKLLDIGCNGKPTLMDANILCRGVDALAAGCDVADGGTGTVNGTAPLSSNSTSSSSAPAPSNSSSTPSSGASTTSLEFNSFKTLLAAVFSFAAILAHIV